MNTALVQLHVHVSAGLDGQKLQNKNLQPIW